ncbi:hypothetical protein B0H14DRAFT_2598630 [Mycena olivaceomarginata]|nr:hypothetical protein B0H14DRAFT_2598630 [Mycena olivaceomarginata]
MLGESSVRSDLLEINRNIRLPPPEKYSGSKEVKVFEQHIQGICQWMNVVGLGGPEHDDRRKNLHSFYLTGNTKEWYDTHVNGIQRPKKNWTHLEMILGLFDQFIDNACVQKATDQFWSTKYSPEMGVTGFYNELMTCANRMVRRPDSYTFKNQFMGRLPGPMVDFLVSRNVNAELCSIKQILEAALNFEWQDSLKKRYRATRALEKPVASGSKPREGYATREAVKAMRSEDTKNKTNKYPRRDEPAGSRPSGRNGGGRTGAVDVRTLLNNPNF